MKKILILLLLFSIVPVSHAGNDDPGIYCPIGLKQHWTYSLYSKKEKKQRDDLQAFVNKTELKDGVLYYDYEVPSRSVHYFVRKDSAGVYLKAAKINLPLLGFIGVDIIFDPPACLVKFPFVKGDAWSYDGRVRVRLLGFINIDKKVRAELMEMGKEAVDAGGRTMQAYHLHGMVSRKWETEKPVSGDYWLGENTGVVKGETENSRMELKAYVSGQEPARKQ